MTWAKTHAEIRQEREDRVLAEIRAEQTDMFGERDRVNANDADPACDDWFHGVVLPRHEELDANYLEG